MTDNSNENIERTGRLFVDDPFDGTDGTASGSGTGEAGSGPRHRRRGGTDSCSATGAGAGGTAAAGAGGADTGATGGRGTGTGTGGRKPGGKGKPAFLILVLVAIVAIFGYTQGWFGGGSTAPSTTPSTTPAPSSTPQKPTFSSGSSSTTSDPEPSSTDTTDSGDGQTTDTNNGTDATEPAVVETPSADTSRDGLETRDLIGGTWTSIESGWEYNIYLAPDGPTSFGRGRAVIETSDSKYAHLFTYEVQSDTCQIESDDSDFDVRQLKYNRDLDRLIISSNGVEVYFVRQTEPIHNAEQAMDYARRFAVNCGYTEASLEGFVLLCEKTTAEGYLVRGYTEDEYMRYTSFLWTITPDGRILGV
ncbi:MAG: hypothetical protein IJH91_02790 [Mogibacterium sp.]|nr:hypothetical protein [Mogibacterium sp.]